MQAHGEHESDPVRTAAREPTRAELATIAGLLILACAFAAHEAGGYWNLVSRLRDNSSYLQIARAIRTGRLHDTGALKYFWGVSYASATVARILPISDLAAAVVVTLTSSFAATLLAYELWGGWVALYFIGADWTWLESSSYGMGVHALFVALVFGALLAARRERGVLASGLGALATTVRPLGVFVLAPILVATWRKRGMRAAAWSAGVAAAMLILYCVPFAVAFHDPLANYHRYQRQVWHRGLPVTVPFKAIIEDFRSRSDLATPFARAVKLAYLLAHVAGLGLLGLHRKIRARALERPVETAFVALYSVFILTYNAPPWALAIHVYLLLPLIPFFLWAFGDWLPKRRALAYGLALASMVLACIGGLGLQACHRLLLNYFGLG